MKKIRLPEENQLRFIDDGAAAVLLNTPTRARILLWFCFFFFASAIVWAWWAKLDEVTSGQGKVIPSRQLQVVQNLEGGIVKAVLVKEGDIVQEGQELMRIDDTRFRADFREREQELIGLKGDVDRLQAELESIVVEPASQRPWREQIIINDRPIHFAQGFQQIFPEEARRQQLSKDEHINNIKNQLFIMTQQIEQKENEIIEINSRIRTLSRSVDLARQELSMNRPLAKEGIVPQVELIKLERQVNEMSGELENARLLLPKQNSLLKESILKRIDVALQFRVNAQKELDEKRNKLAQVTEGQVGLKDRVARTSVLSPVRGTIKTIKVNTVGGVVQPGMDLVEVVPLEDNLLVEARVLPKDIAFLRPGLPAIVKITAYDFAIYGGLKGTLEHISADTIQDDKGNAFYLVRVRTGKSFLGDASKPLPIIPGMMANVDIITGKKSVLDYLLKPILRARYTALRER